MWRIGYCPIQTVERKTSRFWSRDRTVTTHIVQLTLMALFALHIKMELLYMYSNSILHCLTF